MLLSRRDKRAGHRRDRGSFRPSSLSCLPLHPYFCPPPYRTPPPNSMFGLDVSTPNQRPPALDAPPPLLPPDTDAPPTDEGPLGTRRVPAPSPGRPHLARQNSMDFLNEAGPDLSTGRRKVLKCVSSTLSAHKVARAASHALESTVDSFVPSLTLALPSFCLPMASLLVALAVSRLVFSRLLVLLPSQ